MKRAALVSLVLMIPVLLGGCAVDALYWALDRIRAGQRPVPTRLRIQARSAGVCRGIHGQARGRHRGAGLSAGDESAGLSVNPPRASVILAASGSLFGRSKRGVSFPARLAYPRSDEVVFPTMESGALVCRIVGQMPALY